MEPITARIPLDPYYPLVRGYEWIYQDQTSGETLVYGIGDLHLTPRGGVVSFRSAHGEEQFFVSRKNLYRTDEPTCPILRFPFKDGACWTYDDPELGQVECRVHGPEAIDTPAGRLEDCYRVEHRRDRDIFLVEWYAWEVGLAKWVERQGPRARSFALNALVCL